MKSACRQTDMASSSFLSFLIMPNYTFLCLSRFLLYVTHKRNILRQAGPAEYYKSYQKWWQVRVFYFCLFFIEIIIGPCITGAHKLFSAAILHRGQFDGVEILHFSKFHDYCGTFKGSLHTSQKYRSMRGTPTSRPTLKIFCLEYYIVHTHILCEFHWDRATFKASLHTSQKYRSMRGTPPSRPILKIFCPGYFLVHTHILCEFH